MSINIFCINLERATERRRMIEEEWVQKRNIPIEFFTAFDRREIEKGIYPFPYNQDETLKRIKRPLSSGEIACASSHCMLLQTALNKGLEEIIILEDDCLPTKNTSMEKIEQAIVNCKKAFPNVQVLIMHEPDAHVRIAHTINGIHLLAFPPFGFMMVWLSKQAMKLLVNDLSTMCYPADWLWAKRFLPMKAIALCEIPFGYNAAQGNTYIGNEFRGVNLNFIE
jgi:GR25 family glycosyltransferase involved in LPS biosynthesis